ncbi:uncharacterized protein DUF4442 [Arcticibacter tournemirensis]|uniref:DUF4442 domain-containing protein n=1 Tax=Arcticibacter tournemirensis TaxID=699437 RepID=A0A5M9GW57_9SPHI|nr:DUF4442 domain-containing protein [Arcticibacter tournemirensis]KAA8478520.1 DUF4442 domain-containing protein [Arcticibacter tournemirensis]TQM51133.1 uncharacterized protein DUF4442 [Arcticibacter tournemirensis]
MLVSERTLKWAMRFYPPLLFQRIWVERFQRDFRGVDVKIARSILNLNYNRSIFGGTIYAAADPFYAVLFHQILQKRGYKVQVWQKSAEIDYVKPGMSSLYFSARLDDAEISEACSSLDSDGKFVKSYTIEIKNKAGELCATVESTVYIRKLYSIKTESR